MKGKSRPSPVHHFFVLLSQVIGPIGCPEMGWWAQSQSCDGGKKVADDVVSKYTSAGEKNSLAHIVSCLAGCSTFFLYLCRVDSLRGKSWIYHLKRHITASIGLHRLIDCPQGFGEFARMLLLGAARAYCIFAPKIISFVRLRLLFFFSHPSHNYFIGHAKTCGGIMHWFDLWCMLTQRSG